MAEYVKTAWVTGNPPGIDADKLNNLETQYDKIKSEDLTLAGLKTFSNIPLLPASNPTTDHQATRKLYVDDTILAQRTLDVVYSDVLKHTLNGGHNNLTDVYVKVAEVEINIHMPQVRMLTTIAGNDYGGATYKIDKNAAPFIGERSHYGPSGQEYSDDIPNLYDGDILSVYLKAYGTTKYSWFGNWTMKYSIRIPTLFGYTLTTPLITTAALTAPTILL